MKGRPKSKDDVPLVMCEKVKMMTEAKYCLFSCIDWETCDKGKEIHKGYQRGKLKIPNRPYEKKQYGRKIA